MTFLFTTALLCLLLTTAYCTLPEESLDTPGIIAYYQYPVEIHSVTTDDGYILTLHRIPYGKSQRPPEPGQPRPVMYMQHGLEGSSSDWITNLPDQSAGFIFADAGFDVWLGNFRGNTYSRRHAWLPVDSAQFWSFSWDEMARHDLPSMLHFVLNITSQPSVHYMGHSMGTMTAFALFSDDNEWKDKVTSFQAVAPVAKLGHIGGMMKMIAPLSNDLTWLLESFGENEFLPSTMIMRWMSHYVCGFFVTTPVCDNLLFLIAGPNSKQLNNTRLPIYLAHTPAGTSTQNIAHFGQGINRGTYARFDYGSVAKNELHYHQSTPPAYDIAQIKVPTYLYWGQLDVLADPTDVDYIAKTLPSSTLKSNDGFADFNHLDFIWGERAGKEVYAKMLDVVKAMQ